MSPCKFALTPASGRVFAQRMGLKMHNLAGAMNTGVGATSAEHGNRFIRHLRERLSSFSCTLRTSFAAASRNICCRRTRCPARFYRPVAAPSQTSVQILLHQFLGDFHRHQRAAEAHVIGNGPELNLFRHPVIIAYAADGELRGT